MDGILRFKMDHDMALIRVGDAWVWVCAESLPYLESLLSTVC